MRQLSFLTILVMVGCGGGQSSGVSSESRFAEEMADAPEWVRTNSCVGSSIEEPKSKVCGVGQHPIASRRSLGLARSAAAAAGRARIARSLSAQINTLLDSYQGEWAKGVENEGVDFEQRTREAVEEIAKLKLVGAGEVTGERYQIDGRVSWVAWTQRAGQRFVVEGGVYVGDP